MKTEFELQDIDLIADRVIEKLKFQLAKKNDHGETGKLMTVAELAEYLRCSPALIYKLTAAKEIPHYKYGGKFLLFRKSLIDKWLDSLAVPVINMPYSILKKVRQST